MGKRWMPFDKWLEREENRRGWWPGPASLDDYVPEWKRRLDRRVEDARWRALYGEAPKAKG